ncbi:hypothetical protein [Endozoicomonas sp.]|uniref:hypothetical protein n=1 Tax=Endozoicomonas sp. TaxID=1892382 RepID=UPI002884D601|nr:hypothetical protein [Endozoicomonas sp.]
MSNREADSSPSINSAGAEDSSRKTREQLAFDFRKVSSLGTERGRLNLQTVLSGAKNAISEISRFNISQPFIDLANYMQLPDDPCLSLMKQTINRSLEAIQSDDMESFHSFSGNKYMVAINQQVFGDSFTRIFNADIENKFSQIMGILITGISTVGELQSETEDIGKRLKALLDTLKCVNYGIWLDDPEVEQKLFEPHVLTPETLMASAIIRSERLYESDDEIIDKMQTSCEEMVDYYLQRCAMSVYVRSRKLEKKYVEHAADYCQDIAGYINTSAKHLSNRVPTYYLSMLGIVMLERNYGGRQKTEMLGDFLKAPALNLTSEVQNKVVDYSERLFKTENVEKVSLKPANVITATMAFTLYLAGSLNLLITQVDKSDNSKILDHFITDFIKMHEQKKHFVDTGLFSNAEAGIGVVDSSTKGIIDRGIRQVERFAGITAIGLRGIMNGAYVIKDATPDVPQRNTVYNSVLGKTFIPLSLIENCGFKDHLIEKNEQVLLNSCLVKNVTGEPLTSNEQYFLDSLRGGNSGYRGKSLVTKWFTRGTMLLSGSAMLTDIGCALTRPEASSEFWGHRVAGNVTRRHIYKGVVRPMSAVLNLLQVLWVGPDYSRHDVEAFIHITCRLVLATGPLVMWEQGTTLMDTIAAMMDTCITVGEDAAASRSLNKGKLEKEILKATHALKLMALESVGQREPVAGPGEERSESSDVEAAVPTEAINMSNAPFGEYLDLLMAGLMKRLEPDEVPDEMIAAVDPSVGRGVRRRRRPSEFSGSTAFKWTTF